MQVTNSMQNTPYSPEPARNTDVHDYQNVCTENKGYVTVFIGGVNITLKDHEVKKILENYAQIEEVQLINRKNSTLNRGFGFVMVKNLEEAYKIINEEITILGKRVDTYIAQSRKDTKINANESRMKKVFVGGLNRNTKDIHLKELFSKYGVLKRAYVIIDSITGDSRCFGFLEYEDPKVAQKVTDLKHFWLHDHMVETKFMLLKKEIFEHGKYLDEDYIRKKAYHDYNQKQTFNCRPEGELPLPMSMHNISPHHNVHAYPNHPNQCRPNPHNYYEYDQQYDHSYSYIPSTPPHHQMPFNQNFVHPNYQQSPYNHDNYYNSGKNYYNNDNNENLFFNNERRPVQQYYQQANQNAYHQEQQQNYYDYYNQQHYYQDQQNYYYDQNGQSNNDVNGHYQNQNSYDQQYYDDSYYDQYNQNHDYNVKVEYNAEDYYCENNREINGDEDRDFSGKGLNANLSKNQTKTNMGNTAKKTSSRNSSEDTNDTEQAKKVMEDGAEEKRSKVSGKDVKSSEGNE